MNKHNRHASGNRSNVPANRDISTDQQFVDGMSGMEGHSPHLYYEDTFVKAVSAAAGDFVGANIEVPEDPQEFFTNCGHVHKKTLVEAASHVLADYNFRKPEVVGLRVHNRKGNTKWKYIEAFLTDPSILGIDNPKLTGIPLEALQPIGKVTQTTKPSA